MTRFGASPRLGAWGPRVFADTPAEASGCSCPLSRFLFRALRGGRRCLEDVGPLAQPPAQGLTSFCLAAPPGRLPPLSADSLLAVIYGRAWHRAHRLENFQFTQEFPEK